MTCPVDGKTSKRGADHSSQVRETVLQTRPPSRGLWSRESLGKGPETGIADAQSDSRHHQPTDVGTRTGVRTAEESQRSDAPAHSHRSLAHQGYASAPANPSVSRPASGQRGCGV